MSKTDAENRTRLLNKRGYCHCNFSHTTEALAQLESQMIAGLEWDDFEMLTFVSREADVVYSSLVEALGVIDAKTYYVSSENRFISERYWPIEVDQFFKTLTEANLPPQEFMLWATTYADADNEKRMSMLGLLELQLKE